MTLLDLQRQMLEDVSRPLGSGFEMQETRVDGRSMRAFAASYIKSNEHLTSFERLEIYNRQYWFRVIAALAEDFPALAALLGSKRFDALVLAYLEHNPSRSFTLRNLGAQLPSWLEDHPEFASARKLTLALDVAKLEWAYIEAYDRAEAAPLMLDDFAELQATSKFFLQPHLQLLALSYPVDELVLAVRQQSPPSGIMSNAVSEPVEARRSVLPTMRRAKIFLAVHRFDNSIYYRRIDSHAYLLLKALQDRETLDEAITHAFAESGLLQEQQAATIQECFALASELGWFCQRPAEHIDMHQG